MPPGRKEGGSISSGAIELKLAPALLDCIARRQSYVEGGMDFAATSLDERISQLRADLVDAGLDPDKIIDERIRLMQEYRKSST